MQGIVYLVMMVINICRLKNTTTMNEWRKVLRAFTLPVIFGLLENPLQLESFQKKSGGSALTGGIAELIRSWYYGLLSGWLYIFICLFTAHLLFFIAFWPVAMNQLTQFTVCLLLWILLTGNMLLNVILSTSSQLYTHWYYTLCQKIRLKHWQSHTADSREWYRIFLVIPSAISFLRTCFSGNLILISPVPD